MENETFADGIGRIAIIDGVVRLDLIAHSTTEVDATGSPKPVFTHRLVMGVDQFLRASQKIAETAKAIIDHQRRQTTMAGTQAAEQRPQAVPPEFRRESVRPDAPQPIPQAPPRPFP